MNVIESVYSEPEKWRSQEYYFIHDSGVKIWTANGLFFCQPENGSFNLINKFKMHKAYRWWCINAPIEAYSR